MHPLYPINDAPPCTPLPIVKRVCAVKPHKSRLHGIVPGGSFAPPRSRFCTPSAQKLDTRIEKLVMESGCRTSSGLLSATFAHQRAQHQPSHALPTSSPTYRCNCSEKSDAFTAITKIQCYLSLNCRIACLNFCGIGTPIRAAFSMMESPSFER